MAAAEGILARAPSSAAGPDSGRTPPEAGAPLIAAQGLSFAYPPHFTIEIASFTLRAGERTALVGRNGSGKTTWLRLLAGLERPGPGGCCRHRAGLRLGFLRQNPYLFSGTVGGNLAYPLALLRLPRAEIASRVAAMLERIELAPLARRRSDELSGGERKRLALGRALIGKPEALLLDEPDAHLDRRSRSVIEGLLSTSPAALLFATHDLRFAHRLAREVLHLRAGRLVPGTPENVLSGRAVEPSGTSAGARIRTSGGLTIRVGHPPEPGEARVTIDPRSLVVSREAFDSSMQNQFPGRIAAAHEENGNVWLEIALAGEVLTAIVSRGSYERLGLNLGLPVVVSFKANAVEIL